MNNELLSVIVPVYNVEKYICKCVDSILNQTYKNLEIILIDDGSKDSSGAKCDELAKKDNRIKVYHKENGGLSDARNYGIQKSTGKYLGFVDSDDFINLNMFQILMDNIKQYDADISTCARITINEGTNIDTYTKNEPNEPKCLTSRDAIIDLFTKNEYVFHAAWDKIYKRELFRNIEFPVGRLFEDAAIMYRLFEKAKTIVTTKSKLYYYIQRNGSISNCSYNERKVMHQFENSLNAANYYADKDKTLRLCAVTWNMRFAYRLWCEAFLNDKAVAEFIYLNSKKIFTLKTARYMPIKKFIKTLLFIANPKMLLLLKGNEYEKCGLHSI